MLHRRRAARAEQHHLQDPSLAVTKSCSIDDAPLALSSITCRISPLTQPNQRSAACGMWNLSLDVTKSCFIDDTLLTLGRVTRKIPPLT